jgi:hypothetical protein
MNVIKTQRRNRISTFGVHCLMLTRQHVLRDNPGGARSFAVTQEMRARFKEMWRQKSTIVEAEQLADEFD